MSEKKPKCRCYINLGYYSRAAKKGWRTMGNFKPCPIHDNYEEQKLAVEAKLKNWREASKEATKDK